MTLAIDAVATKIVTSDVTSTSWSHVNAGNALFVCLSTNSGSTPTVTFDSVSMTNIALKTDGGTKQVTIYYLANPHIGNLTVAVSGVINGYIKAYSISFLGTNLVTPYGTVAVANGNGTAITVNATSASGEIVIDIVVGVYGTGPTTLVAGGAQTERMKDAGQYLQGGGSTQLGVTTTTMSWTLGNAALWAQAAVGIKGLGGAPFPVAIAPYMMF